VRVRSGFSFATARHSRRGESCIRSCPPRPRPYGRRAAKRGGEGSRAAHVGGEQIWWQVEGTARQWPDGVICGLSRLVFLESSDEVSRGPTTGASPLR
jgi:hypothetical protein